jgi:hypothetical protein
MRYICTPNESMLRIIHYGEIKILIYATNKRGFLYSPVDDPSILIAECENKPMDKPRYGIYWREYQG